MGGKRKKKSGKKSGGVHGDTTVDSTEADKSVPKSIIVYRDEVGASTRALMHEWRRVFLPWSSKNLHGQNKSLKDYLDIASTFSVSHLQLFTCPTEGTSLRVMRLTNGPTLSFRVESFALRDDIVGSQRKPAPTQGPIYDVAPIAVLNNFSGHNMPPEVKLMETSIQSLFPTLNIQLIKAQDIQRVVLFHYDPATTLVEVRHFQITAKPVGLSKTVKRLSEGKIPSKMGTLDDIGLVLDKEGAWSDTDGEGEEVGLPQTYKANKDRCRVKLVEIGPRMTWKLVKIEAGFAGGEVLYHAIEKKTAAEIQKSAEKVRRRKFDKAQRKREQQENVDKKKEVIQARIEKKKLRKAERDATRAAEDGTGPAGRLETVPVDGYDAESE